MQDFLDVVCNPAQHFNSTFHYITFQVISMDLFKARLDEKLPHLRAERTTLLKEHGDTQISN